jgi:hypothetical protein
MDCLVCGGDWGRTLNRDRRMENAFWRVAERRRLRGTLADGTRSEEMSPPQGCAGRSGRNGRHLYSQENLLLCRGIGAEADVRIFASGDENDFSDKCEIGRPASVRLFMRQLETRITMRSMVHAAAITTRTMMTTVNERVWSSPRLMKVGAILKTKKKTLKGDRPAGNKLASVGRSIQRHRGKERKKKERENRFE